MTGRGNRDDQVHTPIAVDGAERDALGTHPADAAEVADPPATAARSSGSATSQRPAGAATAARVAEGATAARPVGSATAARPGEGATAERSAGAATEPSRRPRDAVPTEAHRSPQEPPHARERRARTVRRRRRAVAVAAVVVLVAAAVTGTYAVQQRRLDASRRDAAGVRARQQRIDAILSAPDATVVPVTLPGAARGRLVESRRRDLAVVSLSGLPRLPDRRTYQLWLIAAGTPHDAGVVPVGSAAVERVLTGVRAAGGFAVSTEPAGGSPQPTHLWAAVPLPR